MTYRAISHPASPWMAAALLVGPANFGSAALADDLGLDTACWVERDDLVLPCHRDDDGDGTDNLDDCAPRDPAVHPGATQEPGTLDQDCDGLVPASYECGTTGLACLFLPALGLVRRRSPR